jgi:hypothetical protein
MNDFDLTRQALDASMRAARDSSFTVIEHLRTRAPRSISDDNGLLLAAFLCDVAPNANSPTEIAVLAGQLTASDDDKHDAQALVNASSLLCAAVQSNDSQQDNRLLAQIANYLGNPLMVERCRLLVESRVDLTDDQFLQLINITSSVQQLLAHPELLDGKHSSLEEMRRDVAARLVTGTGIVWRVESAPTAFVLSHEPEVIAAAVMHFESMPPPNTALVTVDAMPTSDAWIIRVVTHDKKALLARIADALHAADLNILGADLATWPDGAVLDTFEVSSPRQPLAPHIQQLVNQRLSDFDLSISATSGSMNASVEFDDVGHPINTVMHIKGNDQPGLLSRIASAFTLSNIDVHHAVIKTTNGSIADRFEVTDFDGKKLTLELRQLFIQHFQ